MAGDGWRVAGQSAFSPATRHPAPGTERGGGFHADIVWPRKFEPRKPYPVLVDVYGGPGHINVAASRARWLLDQWYADQGFIVVALDGRGTPGRGRDWERAIKYKFGSVPLDDQVAGLQALGKRYPAMDMTRVGINGWSFGGYLSALAVLRRPDVFHAGIAGAPVCDWMITTRITRNGIWACRTESHASQNSTMTSFEDVVRLMKLDGYVQRGGKQVEYPDVEVTHEVVNGKAQPAAGTLKFSWEVIPSPCEVPEKGRLELLYREPAGLWGTGPERRFKQKDGTDFRMKS